MHLLTMALSVLFPLVVKLLSSVALSLVPFTAGNSNPVILPDVMEGQLAEVMEAQSGEIISGVQGNDLRLDFVCDNASSVPFASRCSSFSSSSSSIFAASVARLVSDLNASSNLSDHRYPATVLGSFKVSCEEALEETDNSTELEIRST